MYIINIYGIILIIECLSYVNDGTNDPHDWMLDGSAVKSGEDITVTCNSGYVQILGLNIRDFCDLAENALVSVCMRKYNNMHHKLNKKTLNYELFRKKRNSFGEALKSSYH